MTDECGCITHVGPHWLEMERIDLVAGTELLTRGSLRGFIGAELTALDRWSADRRAAGMRDRETILDFLRRDGWSEDVISVCLGSRDRARKARAAAWDGLLRSMP